MSNSSSECVFKWLVGVMCVVLYKCAIGTVLYLNQKSPYNYLERISDQLTVSFR